MRCVRRIAAVQIEERARDLRELAAHFATTSGDALDLRALEAGRLLDHVRLVRAGMAASVNALLSSLHANLADVHRRLDCA